MVRRSLVLVPSFVLLLALGCAPEDYVTLEPATLGDAEAIRGNDALEPEEKRARLEELGFSPESINGLLQEEERANQYGGNLRTAYDKVVGGRFHEMTPDEVQIYAEDATEVMTDLALSPTDAEAQATVEFFKENDVRNEQDLVDYLENPDNTVPSTIPDNLLRPLFIEFDPNMLLPILP